LKEPIQIEPNVKVMCWFGEMNAKLGNISVGATGISAQLRIEAGKAKLVANVAGKDSEVSWDSHQVAPFQDSAALPPGGRVCMTVNGSTLIVATPSAPPSALSLLWETSGGQIVLRGWPVTLTSGSAPEAGLACIRGVHESKRGSAVFTQVIYRLQPVDEDPSKDCAKATTGDKAMSFVLGLFTPVALSNSAGRNETKCRNESPASDDTTKEPVATGVWACGEKTSGRVIHVDIKEWPNTMSEAGRGAVLSLRDTQENEIFPGPFVIDVAVISPETRPSDLDLALACAGDSISLLISNKKSLKGVRSQTWGYIIGAKAIEKLLLEVNSRGNVVNEKPKQGDLLTLVKGGKDSSVSAWMLDAPVGAFDAVSTRIAQFFRPQPALCPTAAIDGPTPAD
jgi:hypothetical protein